MKPENFHLFDPKRMILGENPWTFIVEVTIRIVVLYAILAIALRVMGRRMSSQLTRNELLALVSLAAGIGPAVQAPDRGLLPPLVVAAWVVVFQRAMAVSSFHSAKLEHLMQGRAAPLVCNGTLQIETMKKNSISRELLFGQLREQGLTHLGAVERVYLEPDGSFCVLKSVKPRPGLTVIPPWDSALMFQQPKSESELVCEQCGTLKPTHDGRQCPTCGVDHWMPAVVTVD